jgi:hypothetical protein
MQRVGEWKRRERDRRGRRRRKNNEGLPDECGGK